MENKKMTEIRKLRMQIEQQRNMQSRIQNEIQELIKETIVRNYIALQKKI